jgi:methylated-DNA-[protein]-cysteine S-methyltransferase
MIVRKGSAAMRLNLKYATVDTPFGHVLMVRSARGLRSVSLPHIALIEALAQAGHSLRDAEEDAAAFGDLPIRLQRYFGGEAIAFPDELDYGDATAFQRAVWHAARSISYGSTRSYGWVAARIGRPNACRAVGGALGRNPIAIVVPCHRVVASDGLGGFGGGIALKQRLLDLEAGRVSRASSPGPQC